ncbi:MAG: hypothetical protein IT233_01545 [Bacteroidia bacterium]|nr:hypothetical protein [Bacteroidia bacterium]
MKRTGSFLLAALTCGTLAAQSNAAPAPMTLNEVFTYIVLAGGGLLLLLVVLRSFMVANHTLREHGGETALHFPILRSAASNPKLVTVGVLVVFACAMIWVFSS